MKHVVVGVSGGIATYKALDVISRLKKQGINIQVIMTKNACEFVTPLSFQTISQNYVISDMWAEPKTWEVEHIELSKKADAFLIIPATANLIGKIAAGIADDMLTTTVMAAKCPVILVPSMNTNMYENPIFQENMQKLKAIGYHCMEPAEGRLACGDYGKGKLPDPEDIVGYALEVLNRGTKKDFDGKKVLVTAGPTIEAIDPVRFITNHSSGKMGYAIAEEAYNRGAEVVLVSGPVHLSCSDGIKRIDIQSTQDMLEAVLAHESWADVIIKAAAPADYRPAAVSDSKIKKGEESLEIKFIRNPDILMELGKNKGKKILVGFAAETQNVVEYAKEKIVKKNLDFIVANNVTETGAGFKSDTNIVKIIDSQGNITEYDMKTKKEVANIILDKVRLYTE